jgi:hypothetical protein
MEKEIKEITKVEKSRYCKVVNKNVEIYLSSNYEEDTLLDITNKVKELIENANIETEKKKVGYIN